VKEIQLGADKIDDDVQVLLVIYPKGISEVTQYAIDQFVLRGGKLVAFSIPQHHGHPEHESAESAAGRREQRSQPGPVAESLGTVFDISKVVADKEYFTEMGAKAAGASEPVRAAVAAKAVDTNDVVTSQISRLFLRSPGHSAVHRSKG